MTVAPKLKWREIAIALIDVPREYERKQPDEMADRSLAASVKLSGIHQPLTVIPGSPPSREATARYKGEQRFILVKGTRRLAAAELNGLTKVPVVVNFPSPGLSKAELKKYRDRLREFLFKRQDLTPSQRWAVVSEAKEKFRLNNKEIAALMGFDPGTVTNWSRIAHYAKPIRDAIDRDQITLHHAVAFEGLKPAAQVKVFAKMHGHFGEASGRQIQQMIRRQFHPRSHPELYLKPEKVEKKIVGAAAKRRRLIKARKPISKAEMDRLNNDLEMLATEEADNARMIKQADTLLLRLAPVHRAVSSDEELLDYVSRRWPQHVAALERLSEII